MFKKNIKSLISMLGNLVPISSKLNITQARNLLQTYSAKPEGKCFANNNIDLKYDLQIVVPTYNAEKYINQCLGSLRTQISKYEILVTIINDGSTDGTSKILDDFPKTFENSQITIEIINQSNKGYSGARNTALRDIKGKYIMFLDSDDVLPENAVGIMLEKAYEHDADILQGSWYTFVNDIREEHIVQEIKEPEKVKGYISGYPWGKLYKYSVLEHFQFPDGYWFEDTPISFILAAMPLRCISIKNVIYGYRLNSDGITSKAIYSNKSIDSYWITEQCLSEFSEFGLSYDQRAYEYFLNQSLMNEGRTCNQPSKIREAQFVLTADLLDKYFKKFHTQNSKMMKIERALNRKSYVQFKLFSIAT